jgi:BirA family biotin operon repressor/biotin-[acetyl-CoA-carboxylase] ligase
MQGDQRFDRAAIETGLGTERIGRKLLILDSVPSTQVVARAEAEAGEPEGLVVLADEQTAGRGRLDRPWISPPRSNVYATLLLRPDLAALRRLSMLAALAIAEGVERACAIATAIKWPNDVVVHGRKLAGVLIENELEGNEVRYSLVGFGINVNFDPRAYPEIAAIATSCAAEMGHETPRERVVAAVLNAFDELYVAASRGADVRDAWRSKIETLGQRVRVAFPGSDTPPEEGVAEDVDRDGSLILRRADNTTVVVPTGEVTLRAPGPVAEA